MVIYVHTYIRMYKYIYRYAHAYTLLSLLTAFLSSNEKSILEEKNYLEDDVWPSGVTCGIGNQDVNPRPSSFTVCLLPLYFLGDEMYRGNV